MTGLGHGDTPEKGCMTSKPVTAGPCTYMYIVREYIRCLKSLKSQGPTSRHSTYNSLHSSAGCTMKP